VFQNYNLIDYLTPLENLKLVNPKATHETLHVMGFDDDHINRNVMKLSGGQQQRVAIGRALVSSAPIILADEPTGNLDEATAADIITILRQAAHENNKCVIVVTHSKQLAKEADVVLMLKDKLLRPSKNSKRRD
jgi:lipoprotein-releasing system ATP-binding protein lolD